MLQFNNKNTRTMSLTSFWCLHCQLCTYFQTFLQFSIAKFEQVNVCWANSYWYSFGTFKISPFCVAQKKKFFVKDFLVNVSKSTENCGIVRIN